MLPFSASIFNNNKHNFNFETGWLHFTGLGKGRHPDYYAEYEVSKKIK